MKPEQKSTIVSVDKRFSICDLGFFIFLLQFCLILEETQWKFPHDHITPSLKMLNLNFWNETWGWWSAALIFLGEKIKQSIRKEITADRQNQPALCS